MGAAATIFALAGCSAVSAVGGLADIQTQGQFLGAAALSATSMATPVPTTTPSANDYSMNSGWINTAGCPAEIITGIKDSMASLGTVTQTTPSTSSGPGVLPALTSKFVPSCSYVIHYNNGLTLNGEIFIGMGPSYQTLFASGILNAGFVQKTVVGHSTNYLRQNDDAVVSLTYDPVGTDGVPYSIVSVAGTNS